MQGCLSATVRLSKEEQTSSPLRWNTNLETLIKEEKQVPGGGGGAMPGGGGKAMFTTAGGPLGGRLK